jgi:subtilase family serine protease
VNTAFQTQIHKYSINGATKYANATNLSIPAALAPAVNGVVSMNNFLSSPQHTEPEKIARNQSGKLMRVASSQSPNTASSPAFTSAGSQIETYLMPGDFATIYDSQSVLASGINGSGTSIAIVGRSDINAPSQTCPSTIRMSSTQRPIRAMFPAMTSRPRSTWNGPALSRLRPGSTTSSAQAPQPPTA